MKQQPQKKESSPVLLMGGSNHTSLYRDYTYLIAGFIFIGSFVKTALIIRFTARDDVNYIDMCVRAFKYLLADIRYTRHMRSIAYLWPMAHSKPVLFEGLSGRFSFDL